MTRSRGILICLIAVAQAGCQTYQPEPITEAAVERVLTPPTTQEARERLSTLHNPLLHPGDLNTANGYTPDSAAVMAVVTHPTLLATRDRVRVADARLRQAGILPNPALTFGVDVPFGNNTDGSVTGYGLGLDWEITSLLTIGATKQAAKEAAEQSRLDVAWQEWQIAEAAKQAVYDVVATRQQVALAEALAARLDEIARQFNAALQRHDIVAADAAAADAAAGEARVTAASARRDLRDAEVSFNHALGTPADAPVVLAEGIELPSHANVPNAGRLTAGLTEHRIDLVALRRGYASQEQALRAAILGQFPKIRLGLTQNRDTGDFLTIGPTLAIDLPVFDRNQGNIAIERATRRQLFDEYAGRLFEARSDLTRAVALIESINEQIAVVTRQVTSLQALFDADERAVRSGNLDVTAFYTAAVSLNQRQADRLKLCQDLARARISLELAAGVRLPSESEQP